MRWMSTRVVFFWMLFIGAAAGAADTGSPTAAGATEMHLHHDFGVVLEGTEVRHDFSVRNDSATTLVIDRVRTG